MRAILTGSQSGELSLATVIEVCERMLDLVRGILSQDQSMTRWFVSSHVLYGAITDTTVFRSRPLLGPSVPSGPGGQNLGPGLGTEPHVDP